MIKNDADCTINSPRKVAIFILTIGCLPSIFALTLTQSFYDMRLSAPAVLTLVLSFSLFFLLTLIIGYVLIKPSRHQDQVNMPEKTTGIAGDKRLENLLRKASPVIRKASMHIKSQHQKILQQNHHLAQKNAELVENIQRVTEACEAADRANADKDNFIANISHELRTPLSGVVAAVEMIEQTVAQGIAKMLMMDRSSLSPEQVNALRDSRHEIREILTILDEILKPSSNSMEIMVDDLLESLRDISYDDIKLHPVSFSLQKVFSGTAKAFEDSVFKKGLLFDYKLVDHVGSSGQLYRGDWARIGQVINCLLSNAVRFTEQGGVKLNAEISPTRTEGTHRIRFEIEDTGCGISFDEEQRIFNLFHIGEDCTKKKNSGLGIGLAIAHTIANKLGGKVELVNSVMGQGSIFAFELELHVTEQKNDNPVKNIAPQQLSLLYVEDSKVNRSIFKQFCDRSNIDLQMAIDGNEGWEKYIRNRFDALVVDCFMPNKNGFELVEEIRAHERKEGLPRAPIFALTADPTSLNKKRCLDAGFDEFLTKPYKRATFNFIIEKTNKTKIDSQTVIANNVQAELGLYHSAESQELTH